MIKKTNPMRLLDSAGADYRVYEYPTDDGLIDAISISKKIGEETDRVFKTLVTRGGAREFYVFVIPAPSELDLKKAAKAAKCKSIEMIHLKELFPLTGYVHGGCSPLGMKKAFPTFLDETAILWDYICVSGGKVGTNIGIDPQKLADLAGAEFVPLTIE